jgi:hypothetical protein
LVYDKGNTSKHNQALVDQLPVHDVASLVPSQHADLRAIPTAAYTPLGPGPLAMLPVYRCPRPIWGVERTVVRCISTQLRLGQIRGLHQHLTKRVQALTQWQQTLATPHSGPRTSASARKQVATLLTGQYIVQVLTIADDGQRTGAHRLTWWIDHAALEQLETEVFGKRILITDQQAWSTEAISLASRGQSRAAAIFRQLKAVRHLAVRPPYHWTDHKIRVHTFIGMLALLLCRLVERASRGAGYQGSLSSLLEVLGSIRLAMVLWPADTPRGPPRCGWVLEESAPDAWHLYQRLVPPVPPFVYTAESG